MKIEETDVFQPNDKQKYSYFSLISTKYWSAIHWLSWDAMNDGYLAINPRMSGSNYTATDKLWSLSM